MFPFLLLAILLYKSLYVIGLELFSFGRHFLPLCVNLIHHYGELNSNKLQAVTSLFFKKANAVHSSSRQEGTEKLLLASWGKTCDNLGDI
jgi:hypothetical protein